ncbi:MAG: response regulator [Candidatus Sumerlaeia bacterium]|nr:response regulator [Candidatus Sumerlaeia bacterium]
MTDVTPKPSGHRIVVVDDESDILLLVRTALQSAGHDVSTASNGQDGLELIREIRPDLIILDIMMPGKTGLDVLKEVKGDETLAAIPVIMLTGVSERAKIQAALDGGAEYYMVKPFEYNDLLGKVEMAMEGSTEL